MNHTHILTVTACGALLLVLAAVNYANAQPADALASVQFPIAELGGCESQEACKTYCDEPEHLEACISFAEKNGLMPAEEIAMAKKFIAAGAKGPGGCTGKESCEAYCDNMDNIDTCVAFAEENGLMSPDELAEAKKVQAALKSGVQPPPCGNKKACDAYCESPDNMPVCIAFAKAAGLMSAEEQANAEKMLQAIRSGAKPPACRGEAECDAYCAKDENFDECVEFGKAAGFMTDEEYEMAKKTRGKGPGGCRGKESCDAFCSSSQENEELCLNFQVENGLLSEDRQREMEEDSQRFQASFANMPPEVESCLSNAWGAENFEKLKAGTMRPSRWLGDAMSVCFGQFEQQRMQNDRPGGPPPGAEQQFSGPRPESQQYEPSSEGSYPPPCEGENCRQPEGTFPIPPEGTYQRPPGGEGEYLPPEGGAYPMPEDRQYYPTEESYSSSEGYTPPSESVETVAPTAEPAPAPTPEPAVSAESISAATILFLETLGLNI